MPLSPHASIGIALDEVDTPALVLDMDALERNLLRMADAVKGSGVRLRPHAKSHKCAEIARRQIAAGAVGVCCQKVSEAEALAQGGVADVLVTNEIVGKQKLARLARLVREAKVGVLADDAANVADLDAAARAEGVRLDVLVEVNVGADRCGIEPGEPALPRLQQETVVCPRFNPRRFLKPRAPTPACATDRRQSACCRGGCWKIRTAARGTGSRAARISPPRRCGA